MKTALRVAVVISAMSLSGCASMDEKRMQLQGESTAARPESVRPSNGIEKSLRCIRETGKLRKVIFAIGPWVDSTGKSNASAIGATGAFLPQAGTATFVTDTIRRAGGKALVKYFGAAPRNIRADYIINGIFNSLDYGEDVRADIQVMGLGPRSRLGWAQLTLSVQLDAASTRLNRQMSVVTRTVRYSNLGVSVGRVWGRMLVTGIATLSHQERLLFEAIKSPIALAVIDVLLKEFPAVAHCRKYLVSPVSES